MVTFDQLVNDLFILVGQWYLVCVAALFVLSIIPVLFDRKKRFDFWSQLADAFWQPIAFVLRGLVIVLSHAGGRR